MKATNIIWLTIGLSIGSATTYVFTNNTQKKIKNKPNKLKANISEKAPKESIKNKTKTKETVQAKFQVPKKDSILVMEFGDSTTSSYQLIENLDSSLAIDSSFFEEEIVVRKNERVDQYPLKIKFYTEEKTSVSDSLLQYQLNIKETKQDSIISVELWHTPINEKGYKLNKHNLKLFGLPHIKNIELIKIENNFFLSQDSITYKLNYTEVFSTFEPVNLKDYLK